MPSILHLRGGISGEERRARGLAQRQSSTAPGHGLGTADLEIPKLRQGSYFPAWLLEPLRCF